jgi:hypothetical protein
VVGLWCSCWAAHACIRSIALQAAGVLAVFVGAVLAADGLGTLPTDA